MVSIPRNFPVPARQRGVQVRARQADFDTDVVLHDLNICEPSNRLESFADPHKHFTPNHIAPGQLRHCSTGLHAARSHTAAACAPGTRPTRPVDARAGSGDRVLWRAATSRPTRAAPGAVSPSAAPAHEGPAIERQDGHSRAPDEANAAVSNLCHSSNMMRGTATAMMKRAKSRCAFARSEQ